LFHRSKITLKEVVRPNAPLRLAINGYGRIGRCFLRALLESPVAHNLQVVAINEPANLESMAYLTRYDSTHGRFPGQVELGDGTLIVDGQPIAISHARRRKTLIGAASGSIW
jgi:D-erythrose 4-phosphate dehydrogenase